MTSKIAHTHNLHIFSRWSLVAVGLLLLLTLAHAQEFASESTVASTQATFNFVQTPDIGAVGSLAADSENDIWATSVLSSVSLHFDGSTWGKIPMAKASRVEKVAVISPTNVWAVGQQPTAKFSQIQHFNGATWNVVSSPHFAAGETLHSLKAISANNIFAVGETVDNLNNRTPLVEHFNGTAWSVVPVPHITGGELFDIAIISPSDMWVVGGTRSGALTLHFNGLQWSQVPAPVAALSAATALASNNVWAVGTTILNGAVVEHWNGTSWKIVTSPNIGNGTALSSISAISATDIWATGCITCGDAGTQPPLIEHWDGQQWHINSAPVKPGGESGLAVLAFPSPRHIYVGGFVFATTGPVSFLLKGQ